jgi:hypothetical protein
MHGTALPDTCMMIVAETGKLSLPPENRRLESVTDDRRRRRATRKLRVAEQAWTPRTYRAATGPTNGFCRHCLPITGIRDAHLEARRSGAMASNCGGILSERRKEPAC